MTKSGCDKTVHLTDHFVQVRKQLGMTLCPSVPLVYWSFNSSPVLEFLLRFLSAASGALLGAALQLPPEPLRTRPPQPFRVCHGAQFLLCIPSDCQVTYLDLLPADFEHSHILITTMNTITYLSQPNNLRTSSFIILCQGQTNIPILNYLIILNNKSRVAVLVWVACTNSKSSFSFRKQLTSSFQGKLHQQ